MPSSALPLFFSRGPVEPNADREREFKGNGKFAGRKTRWISIPRVWRLTSESACVFDEQLRELRRATRRIRVRERKKRPSSGGELGRKPRHRRGSWRKTVAFTAPKLRRLPWIYVRGVYPRARTTRFIGAWPSFGRASWVNCKCFRQNFTKMASSTRGEFVYASWLPTWEKQHGARRAFKPSRIHWPFHGSFFYPSPTKSRRICPPFPSQIFLPSMRIFCRAFPSFFPFG